MIGKPVSCASCHTDNPKQAGRTRVGKPIEPLAPSANRERFTDAAKVEKYGGIPEEEALKMITLNPAKQLGIDKRIGSVDVGKDGDFVIWSGHPFSVYSRVERTIIEGDTYFDRTKDQQVREQLAKERQELEKLDVNKGPSSGGTQPRVPAEKRRAERDEAEYGDGGNK